MQTLGEQQSPIIVTKLYRPPVAPDFVDRERIRRKLDAGFALPLTLVSAPAGYGKSSLISHWLETSGHESAWLSLDDTHSNLRAFLGYFIAAVQTVSPEICGQVRSLLDSGDLPSYKVLAGIISNALKESESRFVLALDDYYRVNNPDVHQFVEHLLRHPHRYLHLVIITRWDPPISLARMRGSRLMTEIRIADLQFSVAETATFLERALDRPVNAQAVNRLAAKTEGWPVANRLAALAMQTSPNVDEFVASFGGNFQELQDYLLAEILSQQPQESRECLIRTSVLERFCAPLCEELCRHRCDHEACAFQKDQPAQPFHGVGLLCIPLDDRGEWFRFHHLFQDLLRQRLAKSSDAAEITELHRRSAAWFESKGLLEDALRHLLKAGDPVAAGRLIARKMDKILNEESWVHLEQWLDWLPPETLNESAELLILKAFLMHNRGRYQDLGKYLDPIARLVELEADPAKRQRLEFSLCTLRCIEGYVEGRSREALACAWKAIAGLPADCYFERGIAIMALAMTHQMVGDLERARDVVYQEMGLAPDKRSTTFHSRLLAALAFVDWKEGDLADLKRSGKRLMELGDCLGFGESSAMGRYFVGIANYELNELSKAEAMLLPVVSNRYVSNLEFYAQCVFALACIYHCRNEVEKAHEAVESLIDMMLNVGNITVLALAEAFEAELAWREGNRAKALKWAQAFSPPPFAPMYRFHSPHITLAKILVLHERGESRKVGWPLLDRLEQYLAGTHNRRFLAEALALRALARDVNGDRAGAQSDLCRAVSMAQLGGLIRVFVDLGPDMARLLRGYDWEDEQSRYVERLIAAFEGPEASAISVRNAAVELGRGDALLVETLTIREQEILGLLCRRLSNKEISGRLHISPATVKRHAENLYGKLGVTGRREAVSLALELGILGNSLKT